MTISLLSKAASHPNLDLVFDPYVQGTKPPATGLLDDSSSDIVNRYAPIIYGSEALATGLLTQQSGHADINTLFAAYGTAVYSLPINGNSYSAGATTTGSSVTASLQFQIATSGWAVVQTQKGVSVTLASGSLPAGAVTCQYNDTWVDYPGDTGAGNVTNQMSTYTSVTSLNQIVSVSLSVSGGLGTKQTTHTEQILMKNSSGSVISSTTITFVIQVTGE